MTDLRTRLQDAIKDAMRAREQARLDAIRYIWSEVKRKEIDERITLDDGAVIAILEKLAKQRREASDQFAQAGRDDLVQKEAAELVIIQSFLPEQLSQTELNAFIDEAITTLQASSIKDMGKVVAHVKTNVQGRADMQQVSQIIKDKLTAVSI